MMSLPTPPTTSHRDKENRALEAGSRNVVWSKQNEFHSLSTPPKGPSCSSARQIRPAKSILKPFQPLLSLLDEEVRQETPEPSSPLNDNQYLQTPISTIISEDATITELIRAYSTLTARIRPYVDDSTDPSAPLFEPLRKNRDVFSERVCRDLGRALENALGEEEPKEPQLPSPTKSPKKKKRGMSAEQAKYARDLCTISHSVLKFLGLFFSLPTYRIFTDRQLALMLSSIIAIPYTPDLPTPNARKTYALSICVIQSIRLPDSVLLIAKDSIAYVLGRGIDGELGKEGKKGSASDGLKAIHDLSTYQPAIFVPAFSILMDSILENLLASSLSLRVQASHALGGLALAAVSIPLSPTHARISKAIVNFLLAPPTRVSPSKKNDTASPTPPTQESDICRTLRTTLNAENPLHVAHGPVWGLHVLGTFIVLLGSAFKTDPRIYRTISSLLSLTLRHKKAAVRRLACLVWRTIVWSWHQYLLPSVEGDEKDTNVVKFSKAERSATSQNQWGLIEMILSMGVGVSTCCAVVGNELGEAELLRLDRILTLMANKNDECRNDAMRCIIQLVGLDQQQELSWDLDKLLSPSFLSGIPGILTIDYEDLSRALPPIRDELPDVKDLRSLTREELLELGTMGVFLELWGTAISIRNGQQSNEALLMETWDAMVKAVMTLAEEDGEEAESKAARKLASALYDSLRTTSKETKTSDSRHKDRSPVSTALSKQEYHFDLAKNLRMIRRAWISLNGILSSNASISQLLEEYATQLLTRLIQLEDDMGEGEMDDEVRKEWAGLCVELILASEDSASSLSTFWHQVDANWNWPADVRTAVWIRFVKGWQESKRDTWDGSLALMTAPFWSENSWDLNDDELSTWEKFLVYIINRALDYGYDTTTVIDAIAGKLQEKCKPTFTSLVRIADILMTHVDSAFRDMIALPERLVDFLADMLNQSYPPSPSMGFSSSWMIRSLGRLIEACPDKLSLGLLEALQDSVVLWISDDYSAVVDSYDDIITFYENFLMKLADLAPSTQEYMQRFAPILNAIFIGPRKPLAASDAFDAFWHSTVFSENVKPENWPEKVYEYIYGEPAPVAMPVPLLRAGGEAEEDTGSITRIEITSQGQEARVTSPELDLVPAPDPSAAMVTNSDSDSEPISNVAGLQSSPALEFPDSPIPTESENRSQPLLPLSTVLSTPPRSSKGKEIALCSPPSPKTRGSSRERQTVRGFVPLFSPGTPSGTSKLQLAASPLIKSFPPASPLPSGNKRRRISNKENESPNAASSDFSSSPRDRGALAATGSSPSRRLSTKRKRSYPDLAGSSEEELLGPGKGRVLNFEKEGERPAKRVRISTPIPPFVLPLAPQATANSEENSTPSRPTVPSPSLQKSSSSSTSHFAKVLRESNRDSVSATSSSSKFVSVLHRTPSSSRKRKALVMDCVEIVKISSPKDSGSSLTREREMRTPSRRMKKRRSRAVKVVSPVRGQDGEGDPDLEAYDLLELSSESDCGSDAPTQQQLSSDDDPHLGQVTPGHLISPALRRVRRTELDEDPPSDDSDSSLFESGGRGGRSGQVSPSREVMLRRMKRNFSGSAGTTHINPSEFLKQLLGA